MASIRYKLEKEIPVLAETDVLVVGGGPGGLGAAVMAARQGVKVVLAERYGCMGGMASFGEVSPFMPNHVEKATLDRPVFVEWCRKLWEYLPEKDRQARPFDDNIMPGTRISKDAVMLAMEDLLLEAGVKILYHHTLVDVVKDGNRIEAALFQSKSGLGAIRAKVYIDSTGDGDLAALSGCPCEFGNEDGFCQPMTTCFKVSGVDRSRMPDRPAINAIYDKAKADGEIHCLRENVLWFLTDEEDVIHFNTTRVVKKSGINGVELSEAEIEGRRQIREYLTFLRKHVPGFEQARLHSIAHHIGIRETRRVKGIVFQTTDDFLRAAKYEDGVVKASYPIDIHNPSGSGTIIKALEPNDWYELRYGTLVPLNSDNLLVGCRAISVDHALHSSSRVMPPVCSIGQAAGMAAAMSIRKGCRPAELSGVEVRANLKKAGARL